MATSQEEEQEKTKTFHIISFDLETTGLSTARDAITEFGMTLHTLKFDSLGKVIEFVDLPSFQQYCCPRIPMCAEAAAVTGLTNEFLADKGCVSRIFPTLLAHLDEHLTPGVPRVLLAHNGKRYDLPLLAQECARVTDVIMFFRSMKITLMVDSLNLCRAKLDTSNLIRNASGKPSYRLGDIYKSITKKALDGAHGAISDARAVVDVLTHEDAGTILYEAIMASEDDTADEDRQALRESCCFNVMTTARAVASEAKKRAAKATTKNATLTVKDMFAAAKKKCRPTTSQQNDTSNNPTDEKTPKNNKRKKPEVPHGNAMYCLSGIGSML
jgi:DNA polymerase III epsilon subunit-like protein